MIHGDIEFPTNAFGDFIIIRPDGAPIYNYVVVIDDALMKITHVIRGDDHLSNTPKQALIYEAIGEKAPVFAHIPMILGPDHAKLSKRHGNTSVEEFRKAGYLKEAMINYMSLLSWSSDDERELFTMDELKEKFSMKRVSKSAAVFDFDKLKWMNGIYIRSKEISELLELCKPYIIESGLADEKYINENKEKLEAMLLSVRDNFTLLSDAPEFDFVNVTFEVDSELNLLEMNVHEAYYVWVVGKNYTEAYLTETFHIYSEAKQIPSVEEKTYYED